MIKITTKIPVIICILIFVSCASFLKDDDVLNLKGYEKDTYTLKEDIGEGNRLIKEGDKVKLLVITGDDFIKVYCYPANIDFVKAERTLLLYLFEDDFEGELFDITVFEEKLFNKVQRI